MPEYGVLGPTKHGSFEWGVDDVLSFNSVQSPTFAFERIPFHLQLTAYPREDRLQLSLNMEVTTDETFQVTFEMGTEFGGQMESRSGRMDKKVFFIRRWMPWSELLKRRLEILRNGCLVVGVKLEREKNESVLRGVPLSSRISDSESSQTDNPVEDSDEADSTTLPEKNAKKDNADSVEDSDEEDSTTLSENFKELRNALKNLFKNGENSDAVVRVRDKEFPVHKCILGMRSPVFKSMFKHEMLEKQTGCFDIDDYDPEIFKDFLYHLYTGSTNRVNSNNVFTLYSISHKYDLSGLKDACLSFIKSNLTCETFCAAMHLGLLYKEKELVRLCTEYFCNFAQSIVDTVEWQKFLEDNPTAGNELFRKVLNAKRQT